MKINYFVHTEIGDRPCNEDRYAVSKCPAGLCFALADGLGGLDRGEVAAELACNAVAEYAQAQAVFFQRRRGAGLPSGAAGGIGAAKGRA